jgi:hypothetical protein
LQSRKWCHDLCCSIGLGIVELYDSADYQKAVDVFAQFKLTIGFKGVSGINVCTIKSANYSLTYNGLTAFGMLNDVWVNGQGQDVWCRSNKIIKDPKLYNPGEIYNDVEKETCFMISLIDKWYFSLVYDAMCAPNYTIWYYYCLCSN